MDFLRIMRLSIQEKGSGVYVIYFEKMTRTVILENPIEDFEEFRYWFEQQRYYLTLSQFIIISGEWLEMVVGVYEERDELPI